jgi:hypothetical protein
VAKGIAAQYAPQSQTGCFQKRVLAKGLFAIFAATGHKPTGGWQKYGDGSLIKPD